MLSPSSVYSELEPELEPEPESKRDSRMLEIKDLHVNAGETPILKGINLNIRPGEVHAIMGPNGSGKSTLTNVIAGRPGYEKTQGTILFDGKNLEEMEPEIRAREGIFVAFQYPVEIPGVKNNYFLKASVNAIRTHRGLPELDAMDFIQLSKEKMALVEMPQDLMGRSINEGFSGGEKKRNEVLQMLLLEPKLCILDETDSGLDIDALRLVAQGVNSMRSEHRSFLVITHYQRLLDYIVPDVIHVLSDGQIVRSGGKELALELEDKGYAWIDADGSSAAP
ncbi:MAG: Fe-S cluster assembly ATP-binding protein [Myxococcota bacterium]|jgi:Fe-S cluster assembly ATP-binding protein